SLLGRRLKVGQCSNDERCAEARSVDRVLCDCLDCMEPFWRHAGKVGFVQPASGKPFCKLLVCPIEIQGEAVLSVFAPLADSEFQGPEIFDGVDLVFVVQANGLLLSATACPLSSTLRNYFVVCGPSVAHSC